MICAARNGAQAVSATKWSVRPERSEDGQMVATAHQLGSLCLGRASAALGTVSPAQPHQEGVTETSVSVEMGASKTVPPASTREETSSLQKPKTHHKISARQGWCVMMEKASETMSPITKTKLAELAQAGVSIGTS